MRVKLKSNFVDIYDQYFDKSGLTYTRHNDIGPTRSESLYIMHNLGFSVPTHGTVTDMYDRAVKKYKSKEAFDDSKFGETMQVVVYTDVKAHSGVGECVMALNDALAKHPNEYSSQYFPTQKLREYMSRSFRMQVIGDSIFWMEFSSKDDWRPNVGDVTVKLIKDNDALNLTTKYGIIRCMNNIIVPMYAIDFAMISNGRELIAVDFNVSPEVRGTPIADVMKGDAIADAIKAALAKNRTDNGK